MPVELTCKNHVEYVNRNSNTIIDFTATWCGPCQRMKPEYEAAEKHTRKYTDAITFCSCDVDKEAELAREYKITSMPTLVFIKQGKIVESHEGMLKTNEIIGLINKHYA